MKKITLIFIVIFLACISYAQGQTFTVLTPACHDDGVLELDFTGIAGTPPFTVKWNTFGTSRSITTHSGVTGYSDILTGYSGGPLYVTIGIGGGSTARYFFDGTPPIGVFMSSTPAICPALGTVSVTDTGGTAPFTYQWVNEATHAIVGTSSSISVPGGTYGVIVTDAHGCVYGSAYDADTGAVVENISPFTVPITNTPAGCTNGTATVGALIGGTFPYSYHWSTGAATPGISSLTVGYYNVAVTDALGCVATATTYVSQSLTISAPVTATPATCTSADGAVVAFGSGGMPPYTYLWSNAATTQAQSGLTPGRYEVTIIDANGCTGTGSASVNVSTPVTVTYTTTPSSCVTPTGTATLAIAGGTSPYTTAWFTTPPQSGITATGITYGTYGFRVTDAVGCIQTGTVYIPPIDVMSASFLNTPALCTLSNGTLTAYPTGGVTPYTYSWSTGATTADITDEPTGFYEVTITDFSGCKVTKDPYLPFSSPLGVGVINTEASCIFTNDGTATATAWGGTTPYTYAWSNGSAASTIFALPHGPYLVSVTDATGCVSYNNYTYVDYDHTATDCYCTISGTVYYDANSNCVQDPGEPGIPNIQIHVGGTSPYSGYVYTDDSGHYAYKVPSGSYTVSQKILDFYPLASCQVNDIPVTVTAASGCVHTIDFADAINPIHDMHISTWDYLYNAPVAGHTYTQATIISNDGTITEDSVYASYQTDGQLFAPTFVPSGYFNGGSNYYNTADSFTSMAPGAHKQFFMNYSVPTDIPIGTTVVFKDSVVYKAPVTNWLTDYSPWNNVKYFTTVITASFDPNFKEVSPKGKGASGIIGYSDSVLEYMVHFQNTGTAPAENIVVIDTLDANLDWSTLRPVFESAPCKVTMQAAGTSGIVKFTFTDINLPASSADPVRSNGMFTYIIHTVSGKPFGTQFKNSASIYFDYNAPIRTNTTVNTLGDPNVGVINVAGVINSSFTVYPNPANNMFTAVINSDKAGNGMITVADVTGKVLMTKEIALQNGTQNITIDADHMVSGIYFVTMRRDNRSQTQKLVIIK